MLYNQDLMTGQLMSLANWFDKTQLTTEASCVVPVNSKHLYISYDTDVLVNVESYLPNGMAPKTLVSMLL